MTTPKPKQVEGAIQEINPTSVNPTSVVLAGKTIYLHPNTRALFNSQNYKKGEVIRLRYDRDGNYIDSERLPREKHQIVMGSGGGESHTQFEPERHEMYIQQETVMGPQDQQIHAPAMAPKTEKVYIQPELGKGPKGPKEPLPTETKKGDNMYIQQSPQSEWLTEREKNDTIVLQSLLARAVDIVDAVTKEFPKTNIVSEKTDFANSLDARINNIEYVTGRLLEYVKKTVKPDEQKK